MWYAEERLRLRACCEGGYQNNDYTLRHVAGISCCCTNIPGITSHSTMQGIGGYEYMISTEMRVTYKTHEYLSDDNHFDVLDMDAKHIKRGTQYWE